MTADEARKLTDENFKGVVVEPLLKIAYSRIKEFAKQGKCSVTSPFYGAENFPTMGDQEAALEILRQQGYKVKYHDSPDPGDPRSSSYWEVSWA